MIVVFAWRPTKGRFATPTGLIIHRAQNGPKSAWDLPKPGWFYASTPKPVKCIYFHN
jgi:hypothetical protein